jgi:sugar O-acyltransferase (sialic acid O-acetyltransferase NeuD family)
MKNIVVKGSAGHAKVIIDIIEKEGKYHIVGLLDHLKPKDQKVYGYPILGNAQDLTKLIKEHNIEGGIVAIGDNKTRSEAVQRIRDVIPDFIFITAIHPSAAIARGVFIGKGTAIMAGAIINSDSRVGNHCFINTNSSLDHDNVMEDFSSVSPNISTGGYVRIGAFSVINIGANVADRIIIGQHSVVGAGSTVLHDIKPNVLAYGTPARVVRILK